MKTGREIRQGYCLSAILFNICSKYLTEKALEVSGNFKTGGQIIRTVQYADDFVLLSKKETVLHGVIDKAT